MKLLRLSKSSLGIREKIAVIKVLNKGFLGMGAEVANFENKLSSYLGRNVVCVSSGTAALQISLQAAGIGRGDEILVQSLTYLATFQAITAIGAIPIPCDINLDTFTIDIDDAKRKFTDKTVAIMPVHYAGGVGNLDEIFKFAKEKKIRIIEDAAHAFGSTYKNKLIGSFGDVSCFSFDGIKNITSGEGGCISSNDNKIISKARDLRLLGVIKDSENRYSNKRTWEPSVNEQGWRYHMSDIMAAIGIVQLSRIDKLSQKRKKLARKYDELFSSSNKIQTLKHDYRNVNPHIFPIILHEGISRNYVKEKLFSFGIETGIHYFPNHRLHFFKSQRNFELQNTDNIYTRILTLPLHPDLSLRQIFFISEKILEIVG